MPKWILLFILPAMIIACNSSPCGLNKKHFLSNFQKFVDQVKEQDLKYNDKKWVRYDARFKEMTETCYKKYEDQLSTEEKEQFFSDAISYFWQRYGAGFVNQLLDKDSEVVQDLLEHLRNEWDKTDNQVDNWIGEMKLELDNVDKEELKNLFEDMGTDIEEWGKKLEEIFKAE